MANVTSTSSAATSASSRVVLLAVATATVLLATVALLAQPAAACNEQVCASVVSKCMLTASCKCDLKNCSCCKECFSCLSYLYTECCSCVDMCPKPNATRNGLSSKSHVEDLDGIPGLFNALTTDAEDDGWTTFTYPVDFDAALYGNKFDWEMAVVSHGGLGVDADPQKLDKSPTSAAAVAASATTTPVHHAHGVHHSGTGAGNKIVTYNCTVAFMSQCLSWNKCKTNCQSMGASSYRWFHDGCCECVGSTCLNYGVNESRCMGCPDTLPGGGAGGGDSDAEERLQAQQPHEDELDYGHLNGPMDGPDMHI